ncbi:glutamine-hydrolyzing carbamoyl-phosphate synthase small subunit [Roseimicrobium sp. ORNL1]|uniref:glutamine-hydrolyzing carbamoyl-phosphate synthase small subunit n=1 Tax=Roseimicrobium sp. ORNL1 TaxID=2711231 RepID=UPI0013E19DAD|nr:glutamine-hydrolyzing carbamoyl-phosphate synthase small subunit [Roseimicrobium sp. ORNL1]QIF05223.1 glutamine-hydrolyzing carbamoyl-phosphate synthase small subunit [Roseimicrobium sp. ORNL1]
MKALLALEDGRYFEGIAFGATATRTGEICFNTSMTGYQEVLTDPSYRGQIVAMTYPLIGNYGINPLDLESNAPHVRGFVVEELCEVPSNWRSTQSLDGWLKEWDIPGIQGIDTRALTKHLRTRGAMRSVITSQASSVEEAVELARASAPMTGSDFVKEVTTVDPYLWDDDSSRRWDIPNPSQGSSGGAEGVFHQLPEAKHRIVAYDFGIKRNILRRLRQEGFAVEVVPSTTSAEEVLKRKPDGVFLSNGPGDPAALGYIHEQVRKLTPHQPIFAICLGHQLLGHAFGGTTYKLKFGHRGGNQPVKDLRSGKVSITSQNHGFAVDADTLPSNVEVTHINLNDNTVEGLRHKEYPVFSVQYHPEAAPGPNDASYFFREFAQLIDEQKK